MISILEGAHEIVFCALKSLLLTSLHVDVASCRVCPVPSCSDTGNTRRPFPFLCVFAPSRESLLVFPSRIRIGRTTSRKDAKSQRISDDSLPSKLGPGDRPREFH